MKFFRGVAICAILGHCNSSAPLDEISLLQARRHRNVEIDCSVCLPGCGTTTTSNTQEPGLGPMKYCKMWGDPHVNTFDGFASISRSNWESLDAYKTGDFWFVKAPNVQIQGRTWADQSGHNGGKSSLRKVVLTGSCTRGKVLIVEPIGWGVKSGRIRFGGQTLHGGDGSVAEYQDEFVHIKPHTDKYRSLDASAESILITFPQDPSVEIFVMRADNYLDMMVSMNERVGVSGICGNMNGNAGDDEDFMSTLASAVPDNEVMFVTPMYELHGCATVTSRENDFPVSIGHMSAQNDLDSLEALDIVEACAYECKGKRNAFILYEDGDRRQCRCGWKSKALSPIFVPNTGSCTENNCAAGLAPPGKTCVYDYDTSHAADSDADCDQMTNNAGRVFCKSKLDPADTDYDGLLTACITDYCLVGRDVAGADAEFSNEAEQVEAEGVP